VAAQEQDITIRRISAAEVVDLRHAVLREGLPREAAVFPGDDALSARHYGAFVGPALVCCATLHLNEWQGERAWQLRGMATAPGHRGRGIGRRLVEWMQSDLRRDSDVRLLWCNARVPAVEFYRRMGWHVVSAVFDIPTAGPHVRMTKRLEGEG
jgi:GNAT superfamily N-acetyltransferase